MHDDLKDIPERFVIPQALQRIKEVHTSMADANFPTELDWHEVVKRYANGAEIPGAASVVVTGADDEYIYVKHRLWSDRFSRKNIQEAVTRLAAGKMTRNKSGFIEQYRIFAGDERPTTAAWIMKDLGYLV